MNEDLEKIYEKLDNIDSRLIAIETRINISSKIGNFVIPIFLSLLGAFYLNNLHEQKQINKDISNLQQNYAIIKEDILYIKRG